MSLRGTVTTAHLRKSRAKNKECEENPREFTENTAHLSQEMQARQGVRVSDEGSLLKGK